MWLIIRQLPIKAEWRDAPLVLCDFSQNNELKLSTNVAINLHSHWHLYQSILLIVSCGAKLISSLQLYSSSDANCYLGIASGGSISKGCLFV